MTGSSILAPAHWSLPQTYDERAAVVRSAVVRVSVGHEESIAEVECLEGSEVAEAAIPLARLEIRLQPRNTSIDDIRLQKGEPRHACPNPGVEVCLGSAPKRAEKPIDAVVGDGDVIHSATAERRYDLVNRRVPPPIECG